MLVSVTFNLDNNDNKLKLKTQTRQLERIYREKRTTAACKAVDTSTFLLPRKILMLLVVRHQEQHL